jgi:hypothetical protein
LFLGFDLSSVILANFLLIQLNFKNANRVFFWKTLFFKDIFLISKTEIDGKAH